MKFIELTLSRYIYTFISMKSKENWAFFDRGIPDSSHFHELNQPVPSHFEAAGKKFKYNRKVFVTPPWPEIFKNDPERRHSFEEAELGYEASLKSYSDLGYEIIEIPKIDLGSRADFVLHSLENN